MGCTAHGASIYAFDRCYRLTDKQSAVMPEEDEEDGDLSDVRMDEALMLDQEPSPEYDLDDEQRPRLSRVSHLKLLCQAAVGQQA